MGLFAPISCNRFVKTLSLLILATTTSISVQVTSKRSLLSLNRRNCLSQLILMETEWLLNRISNMGISTDKTSCFVGANVEENCKEFKDYDILTKKNTQISSLSVLSAVCYEQWTLNNPIVTCCANLINTFASIYG